MRLTPSTIAIIKRLLTGKASRPLKSILLKCEKADIANLFGLLPQRESLYLIEAIISTNQAADVLMEVPEPQLAELLSNLSKDKLVALLTFYPEDACSYFLSILPKEEVEENLKLLPLAKKEKLEQLLSYPEDTAGRIMNTSVFCLPIRLNASEGIEYLRKKPKDYPFFYVYCTDDEGRLAGVVSLRDMATAPANVSLKEIAKTDIVTVSPDTSTEDVSIIVDKYNYIAIPVIDSESKVLGVVTVDDIIDIIQEQATADIYASAGLQEDDRVHSSILFSMKHRLPWMLFNLILAAYVSSVVSLFEATMQELIMLATLNNIVAGMGGNTAIQTLTVVTRGIALGDFSYVSRWKAIVKETIVGSLNGILLGFAAGILVYVWKGSLMVAVVICAALMINSFIASSLGSIVPLLLKRLGKDPTAGSGVIVTVLTDCAGFFSFLGIAQLGLKYFKDYL